MWFKEVLYSTRRCILHIDLPLGEALEQFVGRKIDQHNLIGPVEYRIRHGFPYSDLGDFLHHIVQAFEVLDVKGRPDIDACCKQFVNILPALGMAAARHVGVRILVDKQKAWPSLKRSVQVELMHDLVAVNDGLSSQNFEAFEQLLRLAPTVRFDQTGDNVTPPHYLRSPGAKHRVGFSNARRGAEKDFQMPAPFFLGEGEQCLRRSSLCLVGGHSVSLPHHIAKNRPEFFIRDGPRANNIWRDYDFTASSARLRLSTFTRGSPNRPKVRPSILLSTSSRTRASGRPRALATRGTWK